MPCGDVPIDVVVTVTSSADGSPIMGAMVDVAGDDTIMMTDTLGMFTIPALVINGSVTFNVTASMHAPVENYEVELISPGPIMINLVLRSLVIMGHGQTDAEVIDVGGIANVTFNSNAVMGNGQMFSINSSTTYIAEENRRSFDARLPPDVTDDGTLYAVRIIAATRLFDDMMMPLTSSQSQVSTMFTANGSLPDSTTFSLLSLAPNEDVWMVDSKVDISPSTPSDGDPVIANATLSDTESLWAIASPLSDSETCYVQVRTFRRDNNPLIDVLVEVIQFFNQFGQPFFFKSSRTTGPDSNSVCLPILCNRDVTGVIQASHLGVSLDPSSSQPEGLIPSDGTLVNISITTNSSTGPLFNTMAQCMASDMQFARFDLPIANPPPTDIEPPNDDDGFVFLRVSWHDCFNDNRVSTISSSPSNELLALYSRNISEFGEIEDILDDPTASGSGMMPITCSDAPMNSLTTRTACIQAAPNGNVTVQVELNPQSSMRTEENVLCSLNQTFSAIKTSPGTITSDTRLTFDLLQFTRNITDTASLEDMGIFFNDRSASLAYDRCMNPTPRYTELGNSIAIFSCYAY